MVNCLVPTSLVLQGFSHRLGMGSQAGCKANPLNGSDRGDFLLFCSWTSGKSSQLETWLIVRQGVRHFPLVRHATSLHPLNLGVPGRAGGSSGSTQGSRGAFFLSAEESRWWVRRERRDGLRRVFEHQAGETVFACTSRPASFTNCSHAIF